MENKIVYFLSHPVQYFSPLLKKLSKGVGLKVYYFSNPNTAESRDKGFGQKVQWDIPLLDGYQYVFLKNYSGRHSLDNHFLDVFNPGVIKTLWNEKAKYVIVNGWTYSSTLLAIFFSRLFGKKIWLRAENPFNQEKQKSKKILFLKKIFLKYILFRFFVDKCLYIGTENKLFFEFYGVPDSKLLYTPYAVDNNFFSAQFEQLKNGVLQIREQLGLPAEKKIILFTGKYIEKKRPLDLLKAFRLLNNHNYALLMVGEGELRLSMEKYIQDENLGNVFLTGFINQSDISKYYAIADVFVMCSGMGETWGLSVNEAMNFEKPVIVSKTSGCSTDLVINGENGFTFPEGDITKLAHCLGKILGDEEFAIRAGKKSKEIVGNFSIDIISQNIISSVSSL
ncbi:MAG: glycosyltransferase family 4 protein [Bacteroidetes bacterium]|nr:glycosyltransferase family 4 protein [Bacteroidota bacterium]